MQEGLNKLGFTADLSQGFRAGYIAIYDGTEHKEQRDDGLYTGTLDLSGLNINKLYTSIYQEIYSNWIYCQRSDYGPLVVAEP